MAREPQPDRYEAMPSLIRLPGWLLARLSRRTRIAIGLATALIVLGSAVLLLTVALPAAQRRNVARADLERRQLLTRLAAVRRAQRPHHFLLSIGQRASVASAEGAIASLISPQAHAKRARCRPRPGVAPGSLSCDAIRFSGALADATAPYLAHVNLKNGSGAFCLSVQPPGVPTEEELAAYRTPAACRGGGG